MTSIGATSIGAAGGSGRETTVVRAPRYVGFRRGLGRSILLGLELLVAADIVRTVATWPTLASVTVLAAIVLIRSFLSLALELEVTGR